MARIKPFRALRPKPELAARICELPYDVMSSEEAAAIAEGNPLSFLHVSKPEIDLPEGTDVHSEEVYAKGRENFKRLINEGHLVRDDSECFHLYRLVMGDHSQLGLVAAAGCEEYLNDVIKKHELTRPAKEDDRVRHIEALDAQTGPVFLTYPADASLDALFDQVVARAPDVDFTAPDGVRHSAWTLSSPGEISIVESTFAAMPALYIADGHHRSAAAARIFQKRKAAGESGYFLSVIFPHNQMRILPYNRVVRDLNGLSGDAFIEHLSGVFDLETPGAATPGGKHELGLYLGNGWSTLRFKPELTQVDDPADGLDVALLQKHVLGPVLAIDDPRTSDRIDFVGGIRGTGELEKLVDGGNYACAFSMFPTGIEDLMSISDCGGLMPPKSTWFEPKLRDGMFSHLI